MTTEIRSLNRDEANALWKLASAETDLTACFGKDTSPDKIGGEWWGAIEEDGVDKGIVWFKRWIKNSEALVAVGRAVLPAYRREGGGERHRTATRAKVKEVYPGCKTALTIVYSTNKPSLAYQVKNGAQLCGRIPIGDGESLYFFVLKEWP